MRLSFPEKVPIAKVIALASAMFCVQMLEGTDIRFAGLFLAYVVLAAVAFNIAGGFSRLVGAYIFWFSMFTCILGVVWKAVIDEPAHTNLDAPYLTMMVYTSGMAMLVVVAYMNGKLDVRRYSAAKLLKSDQINYTTAGLGCILFSLGQNLAGATFGIAPGGLLSALRQLDVFIPLGIILSTIGVIQDSEGRRSLNFVNGFGMALLFYYGLVSLSKQALMAAPVCWFLGATFMRLRLRHIHYILLAIVLYLNFEVFTPLAAIREEIPDNLDNTGRLGVVFDDIMHIGEIRARLANNSIENAGGQGRMYYDTAQNGLIMRLCMLSPDDSFFNYAQGAEEGGLAPIWGDFENLLPHFLVPDKPLVINGNHYAHLIGGYLAADDLSTGISFSPLPEIYYLAGWIGVFVYMPFIWLILFTSNDIVVGDLREAPWGLLVVIYFAHAAPESLVGGLIYYIGYGNLGLLLGITFCTRFAPVLGSFFYGKKAKPVPQQRRRLAARTT